ncbi:hypothetical protein [Lactobacillus brevis] [Lactiplantibacillus mudanjiangensis]|uniref:DUF669 domain-containing protein n=1 Tax=Lactiplantibacillus mudanjiangensis TaxID=1296538 RepID=UPI001014A130|nr:hypothetical protein [Lactobacillus brevis] [Lactiplantibacillus mudanjiangensis]
MKINRKNTVGNKYLDANGTFEAFPYSYSIGISREGTNTMGINYRIREDVPQEHQGEVVDFADTYNDGQTGEKFINTLIVNAGISENELPDGQSVSLNDIAGLLMGRPIRITNKRSPKWNDPTKEVNDISYTEPARAKKIGPDELEGNIRGDVTEQTNNHRQSANQSAGASMGSSRPAPASNNNPSAPYSRGNYSGGGIEINDDDLPF